MFETTGYFVMLCYFLVLTSLMALQVHFSVLYFRQPKEIRNDNRPTGAAITFNVVMGILLATLFGLALIPIYGAYCDHFQIFRKAFSIDVDLAYVFMAVYMISLIQSLVFLAFYLRG